MKPKVKCGLLAAALASMLVLGDTHAPADSLVTTDGDMMVGTVTKTAAGYSIKTADGTIDLPADRVKRVLYDHPHPAPPESGAHSAAVPNPKKLKILKSLIDQGRSAFLSAEYADARDAFKDAMTVDAKNPTAARGLGFAYIALGNPGKALAPLEIAALAVPPDRSMVLAISSALVADHNPMRAVKFLRSYLEAHSNPVDETLLNALGIALSQAASSASKNDLFKSSVAFYTKLNSALEAAHPGQRRWGMEWEKSADVEAKEAARKLVQDRVDVAWDRLEVANQNVTNAETALKQATTTLGKRDDNKIAAAQQKLDNAKSDRVTAQAGYDKEIKELDVAPGASFPTTITVANSDLAEFSPGDSPGSSDRKVVAAAEPVKPVAPAKAPASTPEPDSAPAVAQPPPQAAAPRHVTRYAAAFAIAPDVLVTAWSALDGAATISVQTTDGKSMPATVLESHQGDGIALLKVDGANFPCLIVAARMGSGGVTCMGFPDVDFFNPLPRSIAVAAGTVADPWTVRFDTPPRIPGGPLIQNGAVVGVELGDRDTDPQAVPAAPLKALQSLANDYARGGALIDPKLAVLQVTVER